MRLAEAILRALEVTGGYDRGEFVNNPDEWQFHMGDQWETRLPMLTRPVQNMDRESIEAYVHGWIAHSEHFTDAAIIETAGELTEQICDFILTDEYTTYEPPPGPAEEKKSGDELTMGRALWKLVSWLGGIESDGEAFIAEMAGYFPQCGWTLEQWFKAKERDRLDFLGDYLDNLAEEFEPSFSEPMNPSALDEAIAYRYQATLEDIEEGGGAEPRQGKAAYRDPAKMLLAWLKDELDAPSTARFVALVLLLHRNTKTGQSFPSKSTIAALTGVTERAVYDALKWLTENKVVRKVKPYQANGRYSSTVYEFTDRTPI